MSGRPNTKWLETMIKKHGSLEAVRKRQQEIGRKGGSVKGTQKGFASLTPCTCEIFAGEHLKARCSGVLGGRKSRRGKSKPKDIS